MYVFIRYKGEQVAIKRFLTPTEAERIYEFVEQGITRPDPVPPLTGEEALQLYRDIRQEVTVLAGLECPYVVNLVGVSIEPLFITIELAPKGSLFGLLSSKYEAILHLQSERAVASVTPAMPGGVLGAEVTTRIALQVELACSKCISNLLHLFCLFVFFFKFIVSIKNLTYSLIKAWT